MLLGVKPEMVVKFLNDLLASDREAISQLVEHRIPCNNLLAEHPTVQVSGMPPLIGMLGIINGMCGVREDGRGFITAVYNDSHPEVIERFELTE